MRRCVGSVLIIMVGALTYVGSTANAVPFTMDSPAPAEEPGFSHTFSVIYWPTGITNL